MPALSATKKKELKAQMRMAKRTLIDCKQTPEGFSVNRQSGYLS